MLTTTSTERITMRVAATDIVAEGVLEVVFETDGAGELPPWEPGAHIDVRLPSGLSRQYSLCGDPADRWSYTIAVLREDAGRGGSTELHDVARPDVKFEIRPPRNDFPLVDASSYLFVAGGIGITPIVPMIAHAISSGATWSLVYGGRRADTMAYREKLLSHGRGVDLWIEQDRGYPDLDSILAQVPASTVVYTCGPSALIDAVRNKVGQFDHLGELHFERFSASGPIDGTGDAFEIELKRSGVTIEVAEGTSVLDEVRKVVPDHPFSCEEGYCGECEVKVLGGTPDHRDDYLTADEQESGEVMMICVSRCLGKRLILDL